MSALFLQRDVALARCPPEKRRHVAALQNVVVNSTHIMRLRLGVRRFCAAFNSREKVAHKTTNEGECG